MSTTITKDGTELYYKERLLRDEFKDYPEGALYMIGKVDEAKEKARREIEEGS